MTVKQFEFYGSFTDIIITITFITDINFLIDDDFDYGGKKQILCVKSMKKRDVVSYILFCRRPILL